MLTSEEIRECGISVGAEFTEDERRLLYSGVLEKRAKLRCLNILKARDKTEWQLRHKLEEEEYPIDVIESAIEYVRNFRYIDDLRYAKQYILHRRDVASRAQIESELEQKGVSREILQAAFDESEPIDQKAQICAWMDKKKFDPEHASEKDTIRFIQFLLRKGFTYSEIKKTLTYN